MKNNTNRRVLEIIEHKDISTTDLIDAFLSAGYGASRNHLEYLAWKNYQQRQNKVVIKEQKQKYYNLIYKLKHDGLIQKSKKCKIKTISITTKGYNWLSASRERDNQEFSIDNLKMEKSELPIIIIFDIPESRRLSRRFLRNALKVLGFHILQKSVWIGEIKIPKELIDYIQSMHIIDYVHIFEVNRLGSL